MKKNITTVIAIAIIAITLFFILRPQQKAPEFFTETTGVTTFYYAPLNTYINVFYHIPEGVNKRTAPILFSIHGTLRNADDYRDFFIEEANALGFMVFAPEFRNEGLFAGAPGYNLGRVHDEFGQLRPREEWTFSVIEPLFDFIRKDLRSRHTTYDMFGHSAGSQFIHRFLFFVPEARVNRAIAANAGWYTLPDLTVDFPFGLKNTPVTAETLKKSFAQRLYVALGTEDNDPEDPFLRRCSETDKQGNHRFDRGLFFWNNALINSTEIPFNWEKVIIEGVAHSGGTMATETVFLLYN
ncbi:MAG: hypothetical protein FWD02_00885 [Bacteroidales bacterium]|nr:hypothetical protein [Bacteroidales bacterium]